MAKHNSEPFWRASKGAFYCWIDGYQRSLGKKKQAAWAKYRALLKQAEITRTKAWTVRQCFDHYLEHAASMKKNTHRNRKMVLDAFCDEAKVGNLLWNAITVDHLEAWIKTQGWSASSRRSAINCVMAAFNYCVKRKKIRENPIHGIAKPAWERRKAVISEEDQEKILETASGAFRDILTALRETGARPNELCSACVEHYREGTIVLEEHKEDESGDDRVIYLNEVMRELVERLIGDRAGGYIFRNSRGDQWTPDTIYCRFKRLRGDLGITEGGYPYSYRHRYASDAINGTEKKRGIDSLVVAKLLGHGDAKMLQRHYFRPEVEAMRRAAEEATRKDSK